VALTFTGLLSIGVQTKAVFPVVLWGGGGHSAPQPTA
jgi:hypothetical protein